jgi:hypothetical protein
MATETIPASRATESGATLPRSGIDTLLANIESLPGPTFMAYVGLALILLASGHAIVWLTGDTAFGTVEPEVVPPALLFPYFVWLLHTVKGVAGSAFDQFRPALGGTDEEAERYRYELTSVPDRGALAMALVFLVVINIIFVTAVRPFRPAVPPSVEAVSFVLWGLLAAVSGVLVLCTLRQLRLVSRLSSVARNVDIFKPEPINGFARLTSVSAIGVLVFVAIFALISPDQPLAFVAEELLIMGLAIAIFVLPLRVMHGRLQREKVSLHDEVQDRLKLTIARIHAAVDANDLSEADQLNKMLSSVLAERDVIGKLPTWPWSTATFRSVASAVVLPIVIFAITRLLERVL